MTLVTFQTKDAIENYCFVVDAEVNTQLKINGEVYGGGDYKINPNAAKKIYFDSLGGSLVVESLKTISSNI